MNLVLPVLFVFELIYRSLMCRNCVRVSAEDIDLFLFLTRPWFLLVAGKFIFLDSFYFKGIVNFLIELSFFCDKIPD